RDRPVVRLVGLAEVVLRGEDGGDVLRAGPAGAQRRTLPRVSPLRLPRGGRGPLRPEEHGAGRGPVRVGTPEVADDEVAGGVTPADDVLALDGERLPGPRP